MEILQSQQGNITDLFIHAFNMISIFCFV
jgi:hypothetical protein